MHRWVGRVVGCRGGLVGLQRVGMGGGVPEGGGGLGWVGWWGCRGWVVRGTGGEWVGVVRVQGWMGKDIGVVGVWGCRVVGGLG